MITFIVDKAVRKKTLTTWLSRVVEDSIRLDFHVVIFSPPWFSRVIEDFGGE